MENKIASSELTPVKSIAVETLPEIKIEAEVEPSAKYFSYDSLGKVMAMVTAIPGFGKNIQAVLGFLDNNGYLKPGKPCEAAREEIQADLSRYLQTPAAVGLGKSPSEEKKAVLNFLNQETKFALLPPSVQLEVLKGSPLNWPDAQAKTGIQGDLGAGKAKPMRLALALQLAARGLEADGKYEEAAQFYHAAACLAPKDVRLHADAARLFSLCASQPSNSTTKQSLSDSATQHLEAIAGLMQVGKIEQLIQKGKLTEADQLAGQVKAEFYMNLSPDQRKVIGSSAKIRARLIEANIYQGEIAEKQGNHAKAVQIHQDFLKHIDALLKEHPSCVEAHLLGAKVRHFLGDYAGALKAYQSLAKNCPEEAAYLQLYRNDLKNLADSFNGAWRLREAMSGPVQTVSFLTAELKIREALGEKTAVEALSTKLASLSSGAALEILKSKAADFAGKGQLSPQSAALAGFKSYLGFAALPNSKGYSLSFTAEFEKLPALKKLEVLQVIQQEGLTGLNRELAATEKDPGKKLYYEGKVLLLEGNIPAAQVKMMDFKSASLTTKDPETLKMRSEAGAILRQLNLSAVQRLMGWNHALIAQRSSSLVSVAATTIDANINGSLRLTPLLLQAIGSYLQAGQADTIEEAVAKLRSDYQDLQAQFAKNPVIPHGNKVNYSQFVMAGPAAPQIKGADAMALRAMFKKNPKDPLLTDPKSQAGVPHVVLAGGTLDMGEVIADDTKYPDLLRVVIGPEGGHIKTWEKTYQFGPSQEPRVVLIVKGHLQAGNLKESSIHPELSGGTAGQGDFKSISYSHEPDYLHCNSDSFHAKDPESLRLLIEHNDKLSARDADFAVLFGLETRKGLELSQTDSGHREQLLIAAKTIRHRTGAYAVAAELLESVFAKDFAKAMAEIPPADIKKISDEAEKENAGVTKKVREELDKLKKDHPYEFSQKYPKGVGEAEVEVLVKQSIQGKIAVKVRKLAFAKLDSWADNSQLSDPLAAEAWKIYDDMKDPTDKTWNLADESWDGIVDEVVITAVTMPLVMGAGAAIRTTLGGTSLALRWAAQGGVRALAVKGGILLAGSIVEGFAMEAFTPGEFEWKRVGFNTLMSVAFHGGGKAWGGAAKKFGIDEAALALLKSEGKSVAGKSALNFTGTILTQSSVATTMSYAGDIILGHDNPNKFWERFGGETLRMLAFHYGTEAFHSATGKLLVDGDMTNQIRMKEANESYQKWLEQGLPKEQALVKAIEYAQALKIDPSTGAIETDLKAGDYSAESVPTQKKPVVTNEKPLAPPLPKKPAMKAAALNVEVKLKTPQPISEVKSVKPVSKAKPAQLPTTPKVKVADPKTIEQAVGQFSDQLHHRVEQWLDQKASGAETVSREALIQEQCDLAIRLAFELGLNNHPNFRKRLAEMVVGKIREAGELRVPTEADALIVGDVNPLPAKDPSIVDVDRVVVEAGLLAANYSGDKVAFKKELVRVIITGCHQFDQWIREEAPSGYRISEQVQSVSHALARKLAQKFSLEKDPGFVKQIETVLKDRFKETLAPHATNAATSILPPPMLETGEMPFPPPPPTEKMMSKMQRSLLDMLLVARGEYQTPADGKVKLSEQKYSAKWKVQPVFRASEKLDQIFAILEKQMLIEPNSLVAKTAEKIGKDIDALTKEDPAKLGSEFDAEIRQQQEAALERLELLLRAYKKAGASWTAKDICLEYGKQAKSADAPSNMSPKSEESLPVPGLIDGRPVGLGVSPDSPWQIDLSDISQVYLKNQQTGEKIPFYADSKKLVYSELVQGARVAWSVMVGGGSVGKPAAHAKLHLTTANFEGTLPPLEPHPDAGPFLIGRDAGNAGLDVRIDNHRISSVHAVIRAERDAQGNVVWWLRDGGFDPQTGAAKPSTNGVWVDGQRIQGEVRIYPGQKIQVDILPFTFSPQPGGNYHAAALSVAPKLSYPAAQPVFATKSVLDVHSSFKPRRGILEQLLPGLDYGSYSAATHEGIAKKPGEAKDLVNEDGLVQGANWALVLDGMGGMGGGDQASKIAGESFAEFMAQYSGSGDPAEIFRHAFKTAGDAVNASPYRHGGAVAVGHWIVRNSDGSYKAVLGHVGDARAFVISQDGQLKHATLDQSPVAMKYQALGSAGAPDAATELKMRADPNSNIVFGGLGTGNEANPVMTELALKPGDRIVMVSDGVSDNVASAEIASIVASSATAGEAQRRIFAAAFEKMQDWSDVHRELKNSGKARLPITALDGRTLWIDRNDNLWDQNAGGQLVDHYKPDNLTVHVYFHDIAKA